jgi:putative spermidine/putrescine transport system substrate-binding protein
MDKLIASAKDEGTLNTIALPPDWSNYGEVMETYQRKYGVRINNANPNAASADEHEAAKALKGQERAPDVFDVGASFAPEGKKDGLYAQYRNSKWDTIPDFMKDPEGYWVGDYYGVIAFGINKDIVKTTPQDWGDLKRPEYEGQVALNGDPARPGRRARLHSPLRRARGEALRPYRRVPLEGSGGRPLYGVASGADA